MQINEKINQLMAKHGTNPTQLAKQLGLSQPSVFGWCQGKTAPSKKNIIKLAEIFGVEPAFFMSDIVDESGVKKIPLYEWVQAGTWTDFCQSHPDDVAFIELPYGVPEDCFAVKVRGHSMTRMSDRSICEGSIVFCKPVCGIINPEELNHKVVIAQYRDCATLKEFIYDTPCFLAPWNPDRALYPNLPVSDEVRIVGVVVASQLFL